MKGKIKLFILFVMIIGIGSNLFANFGLPGLSLPNDILTGYNYDLVSMLKQNKIEGKLFYAAYSPWMYDTKYSVINYSFKDGFVGFKGLLSDEIEIRGEQPTDEPVGETQYYNCAIGGGKFFKKDKLIIGISGNVLFEKLYYQTAWGFSINSMFQYKFNEFYKPYVGVDNLGKMGKLEDESTALPTKYFAGNDFNFGNIKVGTSLGMDNDQEVFYRLSAYYLNKYGTISTGYSSYEDVFHYGIQVFIKNYAIGFGQFIYREELQSPFMFSISIM
jgi:hypothetical protein